MQAIGHLETRFFSSLIRFILTMLSQNWKKNSLSCNSYVALTHTVKFNYFADATF